MLAQRPTEAQKAAKAILIVPRDQEYEKSISSKVASEVKKDISNEVKTDIAEEGLQGKLAASLPPWAQGLSFSGYTRLRYEGDYFPSGNGTTILNPSTLEPFNSTNDRQRLEMLLELGIEDRINDEVTAGVRVGTGNTTNPVSDNDTFGDYFNKNYVLLDQAYLRFTPLCGLTIWGGQDSQPLALHRSRMERLLEFRRRGGQL